MRHETKILFLAFFVMLLFLPQEGVLGTPPLTLSAHVDRNSITVGDEISYEISVTHPSDVSVRLPGEDTDFSPFELKRYRPLPRHEEGNEVTEGARYFLTIFRLGVSKIPPMTVSYTDYRTRSLPGSAYDSMKSTEKGMGIQGTMATEPIEINVGSVLGEETPAELDIQRLKTEKESLFWSLFKKFGRVLLVIGVACIGLYGIFRLLPKPQAHVKEEDPVELLLRDLGEFKRKLNGQMPSVSHYEELSKILRLYLAKQFDPLPLHLTTDELLRQMSKYPPSRAVAEKTYHILSVTDLVKFANRATPLDELNTFVREAEEIIRETQPVPTRPMPSQHGKSL